MEHRARGRETAAQPSLKVCSAVSSGALVGWAERCVCGGRGRGAGGEELQLFFPPASHRMTARIFEQRAAWGRVTGG